MLKFFDFSGNMGRLDFFKSCLFRVFIATILGIVIGIVETILSLGGSSLDAVPSTPPPTNFDFTWEKFVEINTAPGAYAQAFKIGVINLFIFGPIDLRRANDLGMSYVWLIPVLFFFVIPAGTLLSYGVGSGLWVLFSVYNIVINLILLFKPGQTFKEWVRSK